MPGVSGGANAASSPAPVFPFAQNWLFMNAPFPIQPGAPVRSNDPQPRPIISFAGVSKIFPARNDSAEVIALDAIDLQVPEGAIVASSAAAAPASRR